MKTTVLNISYQFYKGMEDLDYFSTMFNFFMIM